MKRWIVIRINKDPKDTYAAESYIRALEIAGPDDGDMIEWTIVDAKDAGAARLKGKDWKKVDEDYSGGNHWAKNSKNPSENIDEEIIESMARTLFVMAWADQEEEEGRSHGGEDLMEAAPETPSKATEIALALFEKIEQLSGVAMWELYERAEQADGEEPDLEEFGYCLAMMALGTGVSWFDDHKKFKIKIPNIEMHLDGDTLFVSGVALQNPIKSIGDVDDPFRFGKYKVKYLVHTGRPSWHQQRAGHISSGVTIFNTEEKAKKYLNNFNKHHPNEPAFIQKAKEA